MRRIVSKAVEDYRTPKRLRRTDSVCEAFWSAVLPYRFGLALALAALLFMGGCDEFAAEAKMDIATLQRAAEQGDARAQFKLGTRYEFGHSGANTNWTKAAEWYQKAADQGLARAQANLGYLYMVGQGVPRDHEQARKWLEKAAAQGDEYAKNNLKKLKNFQPNP